MILDPATLIVVAVIMSLVIAALLFFSWLQDRRVDALRWWSATCLLAAIAAIMFLLGGTETRSMGREVGNAVFVLSDGLSYAAARRFNERSVRWGGVLAGAEGEPPAAVGRAQEAAAQQTQRQRVPENHGRAPYELLTIVDKCSMYLKTLADQPVFATDDERDVIQ